MTIKLNRRQILERMAMVSGGAISLSIISACDGGVTAPTTIENLNLKALNQAQLDLVGDIADTVIPYTDTPGAKAVNVHYLIDELAANWMTAHERTGFLADITALDDRIKTERGKSFSNLGASERGQVLEQLGVEMIAAAQITSDLTSEGNDRKHIYRELRELIIFGYYTSEVGASEELSYDPIPGDYHGCIPFSDVGKAWSV